MCKQTRSSLRLAGTHNCVHRCDKRQSVCNAHFKAMCTPPSRNTAYMRVAGAIHASSPWSATPSRHPQPRSGVGGTGHFCYREHANGEALQQGQRLPLVCALRWKNIAHLVSLQTVQGQQSDSAYELHPFAMRNSIGDPHPSGHATRHQRAAGAIHASPWSARTASRRGAHFGLDAMPLYDMTPPAWLRATSSAGGTRMRYTRNGESIPGVWQWAKREKMVSLVRRPV